MTDQLPQDSLHFQHEGVTPQELVSGTASSTIVVAGAMRSPNYVPAVSGWTILGDGTAEFNNVAMRGDWWLGVAPNDQIHGHTTALNGIIDFVLNGGETDTAHLTGGLDSVTGLYGVQLSGPSWIVGVTKPVAYSVGTDLSGNFTEIRSYISGAQGNGITWALDMFAWPAAFNSGAARTLQMWAQTHSDISTPAAAALNRVYVVFDALTQKPTLDVCQHPTIGGAVTIGAHASDLVGGSAGEPLNIAGTNASLALFDRNATLDPAHRFVNYVQADVWRVWQGSDMLTVTKLGQTQRRTSSLGLQPVPAAVSTANTVLGGTFLVSADSLVQGGFVTVTTNAGGTAFVGFSSAFPNGVIAVVIANGGAAAGNVRIEVGAVILGGFNIGATVANTGAAFVGNINIHYVAMGW